MTKFLTSEQVCEWLNIERTYLSRLINEKQLPVIKLGQRSLRFDEIEINKWLENRKQGLVS